VLFKGMLLYHNVIQMINGVFKREFIEKSKQRQ
jgi:hypothetical protein